MHPPQNEKPKRRRLQFSLRTLLICTAVVGAFVGVVLRPILPDRQETEAQRAVEQLGGTTKSLYSYDRPNVPGGRLLETCRPWITFIDLSRTPVCDADLGSFIGLRYCNSLCLHDTRISDVGLARLLDDPQLRALDLGRTQITDAGLFHLERMKNLSWLAIDGTEVTEAAAWRLQKELPNCEIRFQMGNRTNTCPTAMNDKSVKPRPCCAKLKSTVTQPPSSASG